MQHDFREKKKMNFEYNVFLLFFKEPWQRFSFNFLFKPTWRENKNKVSRLDEHN